MRNHCSIESLVCALDRSLVGLDGFRECALLGYPVHGNVGDHLIWLGSVYYLHCMLGRRISYAASSHSYSPMKLVRCCPNGAIIFIGGGNLGDLWPEDERFRQRVIRDFQDRHIIVLPQSIFFGEARSAQWAAEIYNSHPNLTLCTREDESFDLARKTFPLCKAILCPDISFLLHRVLMKPERNRTSEGVLFHLRTDQEKLPSLGDPYTTSERRKVADWISCAAYRAHGKSLFLRALERLWREGWQRRARTPVAWLDRERAARRWAFWESIADRRCRRYSKRSMDYVCSAISQFAEFEAIVTDRLHGHILCLLLQIPHVFLANVYHKNRSFHRTWTSEVGISEFRESLSDAEEALADVSKRQTVAKTDRGGC